MSINLIDLILIESFNLDGLIEDYRSFFLALLPSMFIVACIVEYFDRMDVFSLVKRAIISILILTSVTGFYKEAIYASIEAANEKLNQQKEANLLLMDFFDVNSTMNKLQDVDEKNFYKDKNILTGSMSFLKYHLFGSFINDGFTTVVYFISSLCLILIKLVYSLVYYLGFGLIGIPCLIYLFPSMGNILRGAILSFVWCLIVPHILVFIFSMIGSEIVQGYQVGQVIGGSLTGTILLFLLTLFIAFTPLIAMMIVNGSGMAQAGGIIASIGANAIMNTPRDFIRGGANTFTGNLGPKMQFAKESFGFSKGMFDMAHNLTRRKARKITNLQEQGRLGISNDGKENPRKNAQRSTSKTESLNSNTAFSYKKGGTESLIKEARLGVGGSHNQNTHQVSDNRARKEDGGILNNSAFRYLDKNQESLRKNGRLGIKENTTTPRRYRAKNTVENDRSIKRRTISNNGIAQKNQKSLNK